MFILALALAIAHLNITLSPCRLLLGSIIYLLSLQDQLFSLFFDLVGLDIGHVFLRM